jgi:hypothetical protein
MKEWRRRFSRITCYKPPLLAIPILLHFGPDKHNDGWGIIHDISLGGIGIETRMPVKPGQVVYASFTIAENYTFANAKGIIRRAIGDGLYHTCGVEFELLVDREHLEDALAALADNEQKGKQA